MKKGELKPDVKTEPGSTCRIYPIEQVRINSMVTAGGKYDEIKILDKRKTPHCWGAIP